jgi:2-octaprenyl-6-methoxyphenol hydroxylase
MTTEKQLVILGGGLSGMITALAMASLGQKILLVEHKDFFGDDFLKDPRTTALTAFSQDFLHAIGVWHDLEPFTNKLNDIYVVDDEKPIMLRFDGTTDTQKMGCMIENTHLIATLRDLVSQNTNISVLSSVSYKIVENREDQAIVNISEGNTSYLITTDLVLVCDGRNSDVRKKYFSTSVEKDYAQKAVTFIVNHEKEHESTAVEHFKQNGPFAILPLRDQHSSSVVWCLNDRYANMLQHISKEEFMYLLQENFGAFLGKISLRDNIWPLTFFPLKASIVDRYYNNSLVLIADSAHTIHPLAGQGLNQGIKDISALHGLVQNSAFIDNKLSLLREYEKMRASDNKNMFIITDTINAMFSSSSSILRYFRQMAFKIIESTPFIKKSIISYAKGIRK